MIITDSFRKDFLKIFHSEIYIIHLAKKLKTTAFYKLEIPYQKFKFDVGGISVRGIIVLSVSENMIPIFIVKKSDKKYGMNLGISNKNKAVFSLKYDKMLLDIKNENYIKI